MARIAVIKRWYCKCGHCGYISIKYRKMVMHIRFMHPDFEVIIYERFERMGRDEQPVSE